jgi:hypothetical protein
MGGFFWVIFSVIYGVSLGFGGSESPTLRALVYVFGFLFFFSVPIAVVVEIVRWARRRRIRPVQPAVVTGFRYCSHCGNQLQSGSMFCDRCGARL